MERVCSSCGTTFTKDYARQSKCKPCKRAYDREYHAKRSQEVKLRKQELQVSRRHHIRDLYIEYLKSQHCVLCGEDDIVVLELDHLDPSEKLMCVSDMVGRGFSWESIEKEISKCRVLCCNCHRRHTAEQLGWEKALGI